MNPVNYGKKLRCDSNMQGTLELLEQSMWCYMPQAGLALTRLLRMLSNFWFSCFHLPSTYRAHATLPSLHNAVLEMEPMVLCKTSFNWTTFLVPYLQFITLLKSFTLANIIVGLIFINYSYFLANVFLEFICYAI